MSISQDELDLLRDRFIEEWKQLEARLRDAGFDPDFAGKGSAYLREVLERCHNIQSRALVIFNSSDMQQTPELLDGFVINLRIQIEIFEVWAQEFEELLSEYLPPEDDDSDESHLD